MGERRASELQNAYTRIGAGMPPLNPWLLDGGGEGLVLVLSWSPNESQADFELLPILGS